MRRRLIAILIISTILLVPLSVSAQDTTPLPPDRLSEDTPTSSPGNARENARERFEERLNDRRAQLRDNLDNTRRQLLARTCLAAQNALDAVSDGAQTLYRNRLSLFERLSERLDAIVARLNANHPGVDTTELEAVIDELETMTGEFVADMELYVLALDAAANDEDCSDAPADFHDSLETARELRSELSTASQSIKSYLQNEVKQAVTGIRSQLAETSA